MKRFLTILMTLLVASTIGISAQKTHSSGSSRKEMRQEMENFKMKFLAQEMELQGEAQRKFFELYEKHSSSMGECFREKKKIEKALKAIATPSDADYADYQKKLAAVKQKEQAAEAAYETQCEKLLTAKQLYKMRQAEEKFREKMLELKSKNSKKSGSRNSASGGHGKK